MKPHVLRIATYVWGAIFASVIVLAACSGGGSQNVAPPAPNNPVPAPSATQSNSVSILFSQTAPVTLPAVDGTTSTLSLPANNAPHGATLTVSVSSGTPPGAPNVPASNPTIYESFTLTSSADVTFNAFPKISLTLTTPPKNQGNFYAWMYNAAERTWTDLGKVNVSGSTLSFGGGTTGTTLHRDATYIITPFTSAPGASCPTPSPGPSVTPSAGPSLSPSPVPSITPVPCNTPPAATPGPTPAGTKLYVTNACSTQPGTVLAYMTVFDESGNLIPVSGIFPGMLGSGAIAFDSLNQELYAAGTGEASRIEAFDLNGNEIGTSGNFPTPNAAPPSAIAFDPNNRHLYAAFGTPINEMRVYDENGNAVSTGGTFPNLDNPTGIAFDSSNRNFYVTNRDNNGVTVYDEDGNQLTVPGTFPQLNAPMGIAFDPVNRHLYATSSVHTIVIYDESGNLIRAVDHEGETGLGGVWMSIAFDATNQDFYVTTGAFGNASTGMFSLGSVVKFDQNGNLVPVSGKFPFLGTPGGIAVVP